jgi:hypothetical protein
MNPCKKHDPAHYEKLVKMLAHSFAPYCEDPQTGEVNMTALAEVVAHELDHDEWLDDPNHELWSIALAVAEENSQ